MSKHTILFISDPNSTDAPVALPFTDLLDVTAAWRWVQFNSWFSLQGMDIDRMKAIVNDFESVDTSSRESVLAAEGSIRSLVTDFVAATGLTGVAVDLQETR